MQGHNGMGYCPFSVLGRDPEMVSRQEGPGAHDRAHRPGARLCGIRPTAQLHA